ncbi:hypothetical protein Slin14017_G092470 [Septoria linicola]|nr:hypothetical protein Slin14017_G092470 [Septoria linicola]
MARTMRPLSRRLLCLHRQFHTSTPAQSSDSSSHSELLSRLKEIDSIALATTKHQIAAISSAASTLSSLTSQAIASASTIQLNPSIPPYKPRPWTSHSQTLPPKFQTLAARIERLDLNLSDLEAIPYKTEEGETESQKFKAQIARGTEADKWTEYQNLKFQEDAVAHRLKTSVEGLEGLIDSWREANSAAGSTGSAAKQGGSGTEKKFKPAFQRVVAGSVIEAEGGKKKAKGKTILAESVKKNKEGWGKGAIDVADVDVKMKNPFTIRKHESGPRLAQWETVVSKTKAGHSSTTPAKQEGSEVKPETEKGPQLPNKPKSLLALQAEIDKSLKS